MVGEVKNLQLIPVSARDAPQAPVRKQLDDVQKGTTNLAKLDLPNPGQDAPAKAVSEVEKSRQLDEAVSELNSVAQSLQRELLLTVDEQTGDVVVKVLDKESDEIIRQIPSEEVLELRKNMESMKGVIFKGSA